ncbi:PP2C family protein-serine/threonine phosphatase [uncultured Jatrophihabitans sp.]|uniref:PP2C family protein-serine/threonine phosphatase n=1 Tax=uncultured Jatrophihabitans sp. TaxID=1610747 RepID=UPI0035CBFFE2
MTASAFPLALQPAGRSSNAEAAEPAVARVVPVRDSELTAGQVRARHVEQLSAGTAVDDRFDRITALATTLFGVPMSAVTLVDEETVHFPGNSGFDDLAPVSRGSAFCDVTVKLGSPVVVGDVTADARFADLPVVNGPPYLRFYAGVPLNDEDGVTVGTFSLFDTVPRQLDRTQLVMLSQLASWARRELVDSTEMERARTVQRSLLPTRTVAPPGYAMAGVCLPTKGVGGDFFDHAVVNGKLLLTLMDVMGKGVSAALVAASVRALIRASVSHQVALVGTSGDRRGSRVTDVVTATDALVTDDLAQTGTLVTGFAAVVDPPTGVITWVDAGHGLAIIVRQDGTSERLVGEDLPIGLGLGGRWTEHRSRLLPGDVLLVVSDGLFDLLGGTAESFERGIRYLVLADPDPATLVERIEDLTSLAVALDDVTALAVRRAEVSA